MRVSFGRILVAGLFALAFSTPAQAAIISFSHTYDPTDVFITEGGSDFSYVHDLAFAVPTPLTIPPALVTSATLNVFLADEMGGGSEDFLIKIEVGDFINKGNVGSTATVEFILGTLVINSLNADGKLNVTIKAGNQVDSQTERFIFRSSTLSGMASTDPANDLVPAAEPATLLLLGTGLAGVARLRRRRQ